MPAKYSHVKKRSASGLLKKATSTGQTKDVVHYHPKAHAPNPHIDKSITQTMNAVTLLERGIARILLIRYEQDIARLFSTRLYSLALVQLPTFIMRCVTVAGPGWAAHNADSDEVKDFLRAVISMDMREAGERVATKSVLWSYTALRHFVGYLRTNHMRWLDGRLRQRLCVFLGESLMPDHTAVLDGDLLEAMRAVIAS